MPAKAAKANWKKDPDGHDYPAAEDYLSLLMPPAGAKRVVRRLRTAPLVTRKAKDLLRASRLRVLPPENFHVARDLQKVKAGKQLPPVLLVRGAIDLRGPADHRRRLPPDLRQLSPRRGRRHSLPDCRSDEVLTLPRKGDWP